MSISFELDDETVAVLARRAAHRIEPVIAAHGEPASILLRASFDAGGTVTFLLLFDTGVREITVPCAELDVRLVAHLEVDEPSDTPG